ncbi:MAG: hypothetical protein K2J71_01350 [Oscillospiraceae bacterium]|nr:hypothetical protein [Oscillospiraceae bacterium]
MDNIAEIKKRLDVLYQEYKNNRFSLNKTKTQEVSDLLGNITFAKDADVMDVAEQLARFSADVTRIYFSSLTKSGAVPVEQLDNLLKAFLSMDKDAGKSQYYVQKFVFVLSSVMKNYHEKALVSTQLPKLVTFIAQFAIKSEKNKKKFHTLVNNTMGGIYLLDYSNINRNSLLNIWNVTNSIYPDLSDARYEEFITDWAKKYGFVPENIKNSSHQEPIVEANKTKETKAVSGKSDIEDSGHSDKTEAISEKFIEATANRLYCNIQKDLSALGEAIVPSLSTIIDSLTMARNQNQELSAENTRLNARIAELEQQIQDTEKLADRAVELEKINAELDEKLKEAYAINSREASLEAQKIRAAFNKDFSNLYEDWIEYECSEVSEINYNSLQAIIKKIFRALKRNGIDFKGNDE